MMRKRKRLALMLAGAFTAGVAANADARQDALDAAVRHLRTAVNSQRDGSHLAMLFSLRQLRDPSLRPLFHQLVQHAEWQVQVHAVLGLAELAEEGRLDPWLVSQIEPTAQEAVVASALDMKFLDAQQMRELIASPADGTRALPALSRLMLHAELHVLGGTAPEDAPRIKALVEHDDLRIAGLASLLLAEMNDPAAFSAFRERYAKRPLLERRRMLPWLLDATRQYRLSAALPWLRDMLEVTKDEDAARSLVQSLLTLDPAGQLDVVKRSLGPSPGYRDRVHFALLLLSVGSDVPPAAYELIRGEEELTNAMANAGIAFSTGSDAAPAFIRLMSLGHSRSTEWVMYASKDLPDEQARRVYLHALDRIAQPGAGGELAAYAVAAAARLFEIDPDVIIQRLHATTEDSLSRQVLLLGLLDSRSRRAGEAAAQVRRTGFGRADAMATLLVAKHAESLAPDDLRRLGLIASGGGRVSEPLQAQAAWLYLKHAGQVEAALGRMFAQSGR